MGIIENYARKTLQREYSFMKRNPVLPDFEKIRKVAVIWQPEQKEAFEYLQNFFKKSQIIFRHLCFINEKLKENPDANTISKRDLSWLGFPKNRYSGILGEDDFDILFNISPEQNITLDYLTAMTHSRFKTGYSPEENSFFDLNIKIDNAKGPLYLVKQQIFYIARLNKKIIADEPAF